MSKVIDIKKGAAYTFKVSYISPVWRKLRLNGNRPLADLQRAISAAFDLDEAIPYTFSFEGNDLDEEEAARMFLSDMELSPRCKFRYIPEIPGLGKAPFTVLFEGNARPVSEEFLLLGGKGSMKIHTPKTEEDEIFGDLNEEPFAALEMVLGGGGLIEEEWNWAQEDMRFTQDLLKVSLSGLPVFTLEECLSRCTFDELKNMAQIQQLGVALNAPKEELVKALCAWIPTDFQRRLPHLFPEDVTLLDLALEDQWIPSQEFAGCDFFFREAGFVFLFSSGSRFKPVLPNELKQLYEEAIDNGLFNRLKRNQKLGIYAEALTNLYGIYGAGQLAEVWNRYNPKDPMSYEEASAMLAEMEDILVCYWYENGYAISDYFQDPGEVRVFLDIAGNKPYYMPTEDELERYSTTEFDMESPYAQRLELAVSLLARTTPRRKWREDELLVLLMEGALFQLKFEDILPDLKSIEFFAENEDCEELREVYELYAENARSWLLRGHRPTDEIREVKPAEKKKSILRLIPGGKK
ncbi:MAG: plasmid pRiA4b ORF-3 family protein [Clostridiales bacterium]|nr:plasmid pRiA4b ORF-3 family protein [Clostridiales bacterium]